MSKIYVFGIGGTGSRVLRSLTMMLASGVKLGADEIVPVIIDPDVANADLTRTVALLNSYSSLRKNLQFSVENNSRFFKTSIQRMMPNYTLHINDTDDKTFQEFIGLASMNKANKALTKMLFSEENLEAHMDVGFKGNPNMGSVVLNQIADSEDFLSFANSFSEGDKIFIISSIFGGTGASGFPLLLKTLRTDKNIPNFNLINQATIGAVTVLPYFKLNPAEESAIDSSTFISKTKSALAYYEYNISKNGSIDALYFLADDMENTYDNHEGGSAQQNDAHMIEFLAATAIVNFSNAHFETSSHLELGIEETAGAVSFKSFYGKIHEMLYVPLVQMTMTANALVDNLDYYRSTTFAANSEFKEIYSSSFFNELSSFLQKYRDWLEEMKRNKHSLDLFNLSCGKKPFDLVTDVKPKRIFSKYSDYDLVTARLNGAWKKCKSKGRENRFMEMFFLGTEKLVSEKLCN